MTLIEWLLSTVSTASLLGLAAFLARNLILTRLKASVQHEFNAKLEALRTDLRKSEESFKADLRAKETQIEVLRSGALSGLASRQAALDKRRLEAIDQLWAGIEVLTPLKYAVSMMATFKFEASLKFASEKPEVRELFKQMGAPVDAKIFSAVNVHKARPFVSEIAWALFSAYQAIVGHAVAQLEILKVGLNKPELLNPDHAAKLVKVALPHYADYIDAHGPAGYVYMLEPLEAELLKELQRMMRGEESDKAGVELAGKIMKEVSIVNEAIAKESTTATAT